MGIRKFILLTVFFIMHLYLFSQADPKFWENLYKKSETLKEKYQMTKDIYNSAVNGFENIIEQILIEQAGYSIETKTPEEKRIYDEWVFYSVSTVDKINAKVGSEEMKKIFYKINNFRYKGKIIYTIGKIGNKDYLPWMNEQLKIINLKQRKGQYKDDMGELLFNILKALEFYNDPSSFADIFYVTFPNYKDNIRTFAQIILKKITNNPAPFCTEIIKKENYQIIKNEALLYSVNSGSPEDAKIITCVTALLDALTVPAQKDEIGIQLIIKDNATYYLGEFKVNDPEVIAMISKKWSFDEGTNSNLITIEALRKIGSEDSGKILGDKLMLYIEKKREGEKTGYLESEGIKIVVAIIRAIGDIPGNAGLDKLYLIKYGAQYENILKIEAQKAIDKKMGK